MFWPVLRPSSGTSTPKPYKGKHNKKNQVALLTVNIFNMLKYKMYNI
jgi:ribosomal protein S4E